MSNHKLGKRRDLNRMTATCRPGCHKMLLQSARLRTRRKLASIMVSALSTSERHRNFHGSRTDIFRFLSFRSAEVELLPLAEPPSAPFRKAGSACFKSLDRGPWHKLQGHRETCTSNSKHSCCRLLRSEDTEDENKKRGIR